MNQTLPVNKGFGTERAQIKTRQWLCIMPLIHWLSNLFIHISVGFKITVVVRGPIIAVNPRLARCYRITVYFLLIIGVVVSVDPIVRSLSFMMLFAVCVILQGVDVHNVNEVLICVRSKVSIPLQF